MSETLRDLVVRLSLNSDNFTRNIKSINRQIQEAQSAFQLASAGVEDFENTTTGLSDKLSMLQRTLKLQQDAVVQYEKALTQANSKLRECYDRQNDYAQRLVDAKARQAALKDEVRQAADAYKQYVRELGTSNSATIAVKANLDALKGEYRASVQEVKLLQGQNTALVKATQNAADAVSTAQTRFNGAQAAVKQTSAEIEKCSSALTLSQTQWAAAGATIEQSQLAIVSIGKQLKLAESSFKLAAAGVKDFDQSTEGLTARLTLLHERQQLQTQAVAEYQTQLEAAQQRLAAAQAVNDPEKIRMAMDAVTDAQATLNSANAALRITESEIQDTNDALALSRTNWQSAGDAIQQSQMAIANIGKQIREADSLYRSLAAGSKDYEQTTEGLTNKLSHLETQIDLQADALTQYRAQLAAAEKQLQAAQEVNDPEKIRETSDAVTDARIAVNDAVTAMRTTHAQIGDISEALALSRTRWNEAGEEIQRSERAIASIGKQMKQAESRFKLAAAGVKDFDKSAEGLTAKLTLLNEKQQMQTCTVEEYGRKLAAAKEQLRAAQQVNDPEKIRQATDAVTDAETALNQARAELKKTSAEIEETNKALKTAQSNWTAAGKPLESFGKKCDKVSQNMQKAGRVLTTTVTTSIVALGTTAIKASIDFESSFASVRKTVDATEEEFADLAASSKQMSTKIATSTDEINEVMATGGQLGIANQYLTDFTRTMIDLGNSCEDLNADEAASTIAKFANIMGTNQSLFENIGSTIVDLGNNFATTEKPIMEMAQRLAGAGKQVGLTEAQVLGFATALSSVGIEAQMGGSAFSKALIKMEVASATGGDALEDFGKVAGMTADQFKVLFDSDPAAAFEAFILGLAKMDEEGESAIAVLDEIGIKEVRLRDTMLRAVNATELFQRAQETANRAWDENTALATEANKRYATTESRLKNLKNTAMLFAQQIGDDLNPTIQNLIDGTSDLLGNFLEMDEAQRMQIIKFAAYAAATGPVILTLGKITKGVGTASKALGKFATAVGKAGGGWKGFLSVLAKSPAVWLAIAAGVIAGTIALADYISGAKQAREALEGMNDTAQKWKDTAAETFYSSSDGLSFFGMSKEDFARSQQSAQEWMNGLIRVWTDGKGETDAIVSQWTDSFAALTASTREELSSLKEAADQTGYTSISDGIAADIETLDSLDAEISALLKKRQNSFFSEQDKIRLQELIDTREAIEVKYNLFPADVNGFDTIRQKLDAEIARAQARGQVDADVSVYENAMVAAAEGMSAINAQLDTQYDKEYALIQLMEDGAEKQTALTALNARYNADRESAAREYAQTLARIVMPVWNQADIQAADSAIDTLYGKLREYSVAAASNDSLGMSQALADMNALTASMDEGSLTEYLALMTQIQSLMDSGMSEEEVQALFPEIDVSAQMEQIAALTQFISDHKGTLEGLSGIFTEAVPEEVLKIATDLDMTGAQERWNEFAQNPGAITTQAIIDSYAEAEATQKVQPTVEAFISSYTEVPEGASTATLTPMGIIAYVSKYAETTTGADVSGLTPENVTAVVNAYQELAAGADVSTLKPSEIVAYISSYAEQAGVDLSGLTPDGLTAFVLAYQEVTGGALTTALTPTNIAAIVTGYLLSENVDLSKVTEPQIDAMVTAYAEATGCDKTALKAEVVAQITGYVDAENVAKPSYIESQVAIVGYDLTAYNQFVENNPVTIKGLVRVGEMYENPDDVLGDPNALFYEGGKEIPVNLVPANKIDASTLMAYDEDGTLHVLITPEIEGTTESVARAGEQVMKNYVTTEVFGKQHHVDMGALNSLIGSDIMDWLDSFNSQLESFQKNKGTAGYLWGLFDGTVLKSIDKSVNAQFSGENLANITTYVAEMVAAIQNGQEVSEEDLNNLREIVTFLNGLTLTDTGENVRAGIAQGMTEAGWSADAETVASQLETALNAALGIESPSTRMKPVGMYTAAGVGVGMTEYNPTPAAAALAIAIRLVLAAQLNASTLRPIGVNAMWGLVAGINAGRSGVISAMRSAARAAVNAAKAELQIHSPSAVFRDEVGAMTMRGFGEGVLEETKAQAKIIRNASRYLTGEAREGSISTTSNDNRRTYNTDSSVHLTVQNMQVRDDQDVRSLAVEIASLTRQQQRGRGLRRR